MRLKIRWIHAALSIPAGLIISLICFSGAALVFEEEIMRGCFPSRYYVSATKEAPLPLAELMEKVEAQLPDTLTVASVMIPGNPKENYRMSLAGQGRGVMMFVDPYSGAVREIYRSDGNFFSVMRRLHRWLLTGFKPDGGAPVGKTIVGIATLLLVFILISGTALWVIRRIKSRHKRGLSIRLRSGKTRLFYDLHVAGGIYASVVLLALSLTGLTWSFAWYRNGFYRLFGAEIAVRPPNAPQAGGGGRGGGNRGERGEKPDYVSWQQAVESLKANHPSYRMLSVQDGRASASSQTTGNVRATDSYTFNPRTGEITEANLYADQDKSAKLRGWIYSVHVGSWGGWLTRIITFLAAMLGGSLPLTGYFLLWKRSISRLASSWVR
jgi:uncharacterized iron-regulated membrane protein